MKYILHSAIFALSVAGLAGCSKNPATSASQFGQGAVVDERRFDNAFSDGSSWQTHGRTYDEYRFGPLEKVNHANVKDLALAWSADFDTNRGQEATPLMVDGVLYVSTAWRMVNVLIGNSGAEYGVGGSKAIASHSRETAVRMSATQ